MSIFDIFKSKEQRQFEGRSHDFLNVNVRFGSFFVNPYTITLPRNFMIDIDSLSPTALPLVVIAIRSNDSNALKMISRVSAIESNCVIKSDIDEIASRYINVAIIIEKIISEFFPLIKSEEYITKATYLFIKNLKDSKYIDVVENTGKLTFSIDKNFYKGIFKNDFGVRIDPCIWVSDNNQVLMRHGDKYRIILFNDSTTTKACAKIYIDNINVGNFVIRPESSIAIERPVNDDGHFTFYEYGTSEGLFAGIKQGMGYITCRFYKDKTEKEIYEDIRFSLAPGGTGLSGHSSQKFKHAEYFETEDEYTEIKLRLVCSKEKPRRLRPIE